MSTSLQTLPRTVTRPLWLTAAASALIGATLWLSSGAAMAQQKAEAPAAPAKAEAPAQKGGTKLSAADETALRTYTLSNETVDRALALVKDAREQKVSGSIGKGATTLDGWASGLNSEPKAKALLDKHQISARDYVMTMIAIMRAGVAAEMKPKTPEEAGTNAANIAYMTANKDRIQAAMMAGVKPPAAKPAEGKASK